MEKCGLRFGLEYDHRAGHEYAQTRHTRLDELDPLCDKHHKQKTREGWALVAGTGIRPFVPPGDPDHPTRPGNRPASGTAHVTASRDAAGRDAARDHERAEPWHPPS